MTKKDSFIDEATPIDREVWDMLPRKKLILKNLKCANCNEDINIEGFQIKGRICCQCGKTIMEFKTYD